MYTDISSQYAVIPYIVESIQHPSLQIKSWWIGLVRLTLQGSAAAHADFTIWSVTRIHLPSWCASHLLIKIFDSTLKAIIHYIAAQMLMTIKQQSKICTNTTTSTSGSTNSTVSNVSTVSSGRTTAEANTVRDHDSSLISSTMRASSASQHHQMRKQFWEEKAATAAAAVSLSAAVGDTSAGKNSSGTSDSKSVGDRSAGGALK